MTKQQTNECSVESSVTVAFAELDRLERDRAGFAAAKRDVHDALSRQRIELALLRERLLAERPQARARARRDRARHHRLREQMLARLTAEAETAHTQRLALFRAELEAKRIRLAALEAANTSAPTPISRRLLEWSVPVAATALVAFLGFTVFDEEQAVAHTVDPIQTIEAAEVSVEQPAATPEPEPVTAEPVTAEPVTAEPVTAEEPEPVAPAPTKQSTKKPAKKPTSPKKSTDEPAKPKPKPVLKKNSKPLELGDFGGNPLG